MTTVKNYEDDFYTEELISPKKRLQKKPLKKEWIIQKTGKILPKGADQLLLKIDEKEIYKIEMDKMGSLLFAYQYQELMIQGKVSNEEGLKKIRIMNFI